VIRSVGIAVICSFAALIAACGDDDYPAATPTPTFDCTPSSNSSVGFSADETVRFNGATLGVEIANDDTERRRGLMNRPCLPPDAGMLFVYPGPVQSTFWMHDTLLPLTIAFIDSDGTILELEDMQPQTDDLHYAPAPYQYAIEANQGWFADHNIEAGDKATLPRNLSAS
jgi:uncharacterized protein